MAGSQKVAGMHISMTAEVAQAIRNIDKITKTVDKYGRQARTSMNRAQYAFNRMRRAAQLFASAFIIVGSIRSMIRFATSIEKAEDKMALMAARFKQFGREADTLRQVYILSQRLGVSLEESANGLTRLLVATKSLRVEQSKLLKVQENIVLLARAGGTAPEEMIGGMRQLSQGLASGRLQGEELRSVLENLPLVAIEIAKELNINIGQIRQYAAEGKITGDVVVNALESVEVKLEDLPNTFANSTQRMRNEWDLLLASLGKQINSSGLLAGLNQVIIGARSKLDPLSLDSIDTLQIKKYSATVYAEVLKEIEAQRRADDGSAYAQIGLLQLLRAGGTERNEIVGDTSVWLQTADQIRNKYQEQLDLLKDINAELAIRNPLEQRLNPDLARTKFEAGNILLDDAFQGNLDSLIKQFQTAESKAAALRVRLEENRDALINLGPDGAAMIRLIEAQIDEILNGGLEEIPMRAKRVTETFKKTTEEMSQYGKQAARNIQSAFADFLFDPLEEGLDGLLRNFVNVIRRIMAEMFASQILGGGVGTAIGNLFGLPGKAVGGPVTAGAPYMVGEQGPELFMPRSSGMIIPNHKLGGGGVNVSYSIDARGADEAAVVARMIPLLERTKEITKGEVRHMMREGRFQ